jgi:hypothetical protein
MPYRTTFIKMSWKVLTLSVNKIKYFNRLIHSKAL